MSRMSWFRMYHEARTDNKLRALSDAQHRVWFNLMCLAAEQDERGVLRGYDDDLLAIEVAGGDADLVRATLALLCRLRIVTDAPDCVTFINFAARNHDKPSDAPERVRERVAKHRGTTDDGVLEDGGADGNAPETPGNTQIREEERREEKTRGEDVPPPSAGELVLVHPPTGARRAKEAGYSAEFESFWDAYPRKIEKKTAWRVWRERLKAGAAAADMIAASEHFAAKKRREGSSPRFIKHAATFIGLDEPFREFVDGEPIEETAAAQPRSWGAMANVINRNRGGDRAADAG